jgi:uncharacterized protein (TIGR01777 family)
MAATTIAPAKRLRIVIPGGSGHLGCVLARHFHPQGHEVTVITRTPIRAPWRVVAWNGFGADRWVNELDGADVIINLAGRSVDCRYLRMNRREILESRIVPTRILGEAIGAVRNPPRLWMNASTATIYRHSLDQEMDEDTGEYGGCEADAPREWSFSVDVASQWEETFFQAKTPGTRKVALRSAMVMSTHGGAFPALLRLVRLGMGGAAGSGKQFVSWVHESDFVRAVEHLIWRENREDVVNIAAPQPLPNREFMAALREAWGISLGLNLSERILEFGAIFLWTETELILKSRRVVPGRLLQDGFRFAFPQWLAAARDLVERCRNGRRSSDRRPRG